MAMVTNSEITMLNNLKPYKTTWKVEVKVLHSWTQHSNYSGEDTFEFILEDRMGSEIHCTCKSAFLGRVKNLRVDQWKFLENFLVYPATGIYRPTRHLYKMSITANSIVTSSTLTTCEVRLVDQHNEISSEDVSASFSKRKERDGALNDINSTSNKLCAMNIKMEKKKYD
uniref:Replication protein A 70 kDa DNA-binding subunit B/D first OB fold domain-containing protein n=1 Tax=Brassica oleracea var. oleracea TaxID=109376 RepID=A0A0D3DV45_BRAOL